jgi:hypothetical protein
MSLARRHAAAINWRMAAWRQGIFTIIFNSLSRL